MDGFLLDMPVLSEIVKPAPNPAVISWVDTGDEAAYFLSVITLGEVQKGVSKLPPSARRTALERWLAQDLPARFRGRILPVDASVALAWGAL